ncbi:MAG TPA: universal stress protein [Bacteroidia bacterium]|jgi:nucleotide-binding universal stress UspA family protein|nr:universal stress protein [Bacteroidia bacterium]
MKKLQIRNILVPTDFSKTGLLAVEHAAFMARLCKANLHLLHVVEISDTVYNIYNPAILINDFGEVKKLAEKRLNELAEKLKKEYIIDIKPVCKTGHTTSGIIETVKENNIDVVVIGTHGASGFDEFFMGSNAYKIVTVCTCPVVTVQTHYKKLGFTNIVLPIDDCVYSRQKVDTTIALAKRYAAKINVYGFIEKGDDTDSKKFKIKIDSVEKAVRKAGLPYEIKIAKGNNFAESVLSYSKKIKADLIVLLTDHESHMKSMFLGAFAKRIVNHSRIPVMSIRPEESGVYDPVSLAGSNGF